jgi:ribonuclease HI
MSADAALSIHIDGAARGNPGPAAFAYVIERTGMPAVEEKGRLGSATNNVAEYTALVKAFERAHELGGRRVIVHSDSELLVKQMNGQYRVKSADLRPLFEQAKQLARQFDIVTVRHIPRSENNQADRLCNEALDEGLPRRARSLKGNRPSKPFGPPPDGLQDQALDCLRAAAAAWSGGDAQHPAPEAVWEQLWSIIEDHGVLRRPSPR